MGIHDGHRDRVKDVFLQNGLDALPPHEVLEMILFYSVPRKDTNELAHRLLDAFGGKFDRVLDADYNELMEVEGITKNSAVLIKALPQIARYYAVSKTQRGKSLNDRVDMGEYFISRFIGETNEVLYVLMMDSACRPLSCTRFDEGTSDSLNVYYDKILFHVAHSRGKLVAIAHNHPNGEPYPSSEDYAVTKNLEKAIRTIDKHLWDHVVVGDDCFISMREERVLSPIL